MREGFARRKIKGILFTGIDELGQSNNKHYLAVQSEDNIAPSGHTWIDGLYYIEVDPKLIKRLNAV